MCIDYFFFFFFCGECPHEHHRGNDSEDGRSVIGNSPCRSPVNYRCQLLHFVVDQPEEMWVLDWISVSLDLSDSVAKEQTKAGPTPACSARK